MENKDISPFLFLTMADDLTEITEAEFRDCLNNIIDEMEGQYRELKNTYEQFVRLQNNYLEDKNEFDLKYYINKDQTALSYTRHHKTPIGFKVGDRKVIDDAAGTR